MELKLRRQSHKQFLLGARCTEARRGEKEIVWIYTKNTSGGAFFKHPGYELISSLARTLLHKFVLACAQLEPRMFKKRASGGQVTKIAEIHFLENVLAYFILDRLPPWPVEMVSPICDSWINFNCVHNHCYCCCFYCVVQIWLDLIVISIITDWFKHFSCQKKLGSLEKLMPIFYSKSDSLQVHTWAMGTSYAS